MKDPWAELINEIKELRIDLDDTRKELHTSNNEIRRLHETLQNETKNKATATKAKVTSAKVKAASNNATFQIGDNAKAAELKSTGTVDSFGNTIYFGEVVVLKTPSTGRFKRANLFQVGDRVIVQGLTRKLGDLKVRHETIPKETTIRDSANLTKLV